MSSDESKVSLQVNVAPSDLRYMTHTIPHQLRVFADQVDEIQFTLDSRPQAKSKYSTEAFQHHLAAAREVLAGFIAAHPHAYVREIDYSTQTVRKISAALGVPGELPMHSMNGTPFYGYVFGLYEANGEFVLHLDADMLFGGASKTWVREALAALTSDERLLVVSPLPGPPAQDGELAQKYIERLPAPYPAFTFNRISSRVFLANRKRLLFENPLPIVPAQGPLRRLIALVNNMPAVEVYEWSLSALLVKHDLLRLDMLGRDGGLWSLHPAYRSEKFYERLPGIIADVEAGTIPDAQRGDYDLNDSMIDWSDARRAKTLNRIRRYARYATERIFNRPLHN